MQGVKRFSVQTPTPHPYLIPIYSPWAKAKKKFNLLLLFHRIFPSLTIFFSHIFILYINPYRNVARGGGQIPSPHLYDQREIYIFLWLRAHKNVMHPFWVEKAYGHSRMYPIFFWLFKGISIGRRPLLGGWFRIPRKFSIW